MKPAPPKHLRIKRLNQRNRRTILQLRCEQQKWICPLCGRKMSIYDRSNGDDARPEEATLDHIIRLADGGTDLLTNIRAMCKRCNNTRHSPNFTP